MPSYHYLLEDIIDEAEGKVTRIKLPQLVNEIERYLWTNLNGLWMNVTETISVTAGNYQVTVDTTDWMQIIYAIDGDDKEELERTTMKKIEYLRENNSGYTTLEKYYIDKLKNSSSTLTLFGTPDEDTSVIVYTKQREAALVATDDESNKWMLGEGYGLLKYAVLSKRIFHEKKWPAWKQEYDRFLKEVRKYMGQEKRTYKNNYERRFF